MCSSAYHVFQPDCDINIQNVAAVPAHVLELQLLVTRLAVQADEFYGKYESRIGRDNTTKSTGT